MLPRWKYFLWRLLQRALPTKDNLRKRGIQITTECVVCKNGLESQSHLFRDCYVAQLVWKSSPLGIISSNAANVRMEEWLMNFLSYFFDQDGREEGRLIQFTSILWSIWLHRNDILFRGVSGSPETILKAAQAHVHRWEQLQEFKKATSQVVQEVDKAHRNQKVCVFKMGNCQSNNFIAVVVDAAWKKYDKMSRKHWIAAVGWEEDTNQPPRVQGAMKIFAQDPMQAECYAIYWGLHHVSQVARNVLLKSDCREVVQALQDPRKASKHVASILVDIKNMAASLDYFVCINVCRDQVVKAHSLAQQERKCL